VVQRNSNFIVSDFIACARYHGFSVAFKGTNLKPGVPPETDFIAWSLANDEDAIAVAKRSISVKIVSKMLADGRNWSKFREAWSKCAR
jgi:hypothetical protein